ncbi:DUF4192 domain-containing protein (plasmid) [Citricoccus nitrophenolicus]
MTTFTATTIADVLDYAAGVLGLRPTRSLVVLPMQDNALGPVLRTDAPGADVPAQALADSIIENLSHALADGALLIGFDAAPTVVQAVAEAMTERGLPIHETIHVAGNRYTAFNGTEGEWHPGRTAIGLETAYNRDERDEIPDLLDHAGLAAEPAISEWARLVREDRSEAMAEVRDLWATVLTGHEPTPGQILTLRAAFSLYEFRDRLLGDTYGAGDGEEWGAIFTGDPAEPVAWGKVDAAETTLRLLITKADSPEAAHLLALLAHIYWMQGRGTVAGQAADRACEADEVNTFARLVSRLTNAGKLAPVARDRDRAWATTRPQ